MFTGIRKYIVQNGVKLVLIDSDGTIKNLKWEHMTVIIEMCKRRGGPPNDLAIMANKFFISFIESGMLPTNQNMQVILCFLNSLLLGEEFKMFKEEYFNEYYKTRKIFHGSEEFLEEITSAGAEYIIVSKNLQSKNFFDGNRIAKAHNIIINKSKLTGFKQAIDRALVSEQYDILPDEILIIGDNFWDDVLPAMSLKVRVLWCNKYGNATKGKLNEYLRRMYKKALDNSKGNSIW